MMKHILQLEYSCYRPDIPHHTISTQFQVLELQCLQVFSPAMHYITIFH
uniref:Uncharacterized protein n=1 Tax=Anguilla anguilla TaxID=7936 RepID=A0A0E9R5V1_ANGAN